MRIVAIREDLVRYSTTGGMDVERPVRGHVECSPVEVRALFGPTSMEAGLEVASVVTPAGMVRLREIARGEQEGTVRYRVEAASFAAVFWVCTVLLGSPASAVTTALDRGTQVSQRALMHGFAEYLRGRWLRPVGESDESWNGRRDECAVMAAEMGGVAETDLFGASTLGDLLSGQWPELPGGTVWQRVLGWAHGLRVREPRRATAGRYDRSSLADALYDLGGLRRAHLAWFERRHPGAPLDEYRGYVDTILALGNAPEAAEPEPEPEPQPEPERQVLTFEIAKSLAVRPLGTSVADDAAVQVGRLPGWCVELTFEGDVSKGIGLDTPAGRAELWPEHRLPGGQNGWRVHGSLKAFLWVVKVVAGSTADLGKVVLASEPGNMIWALTEAYAEFLEVRGSRRWADQLMAALGLAEQQGGAPADLAGRLVQLAREAGPGEHAVTLGGIAALAASPR
jgi:hypothetical protein